MTTIGEASLRPGDVVETGKHGTLRVALTEPRAFFAFKIEEGSPKVRLASYEDIEEYRAREHVDDDEVRAGWFSDGEELFEEIEEVDA